MTIDLNPDLAQWFTPDWLADHLIDSARVPQGYGRPLRVLEPFGVSSRYLRDALASVASFGGRINIALGVSPIDPVTIISECGENLAVVMPVRI